MRVTALCGGVGASRFMQGLYSMRNEHEVTAIVNVGDDVIISGLYISPDLDTVTYALAGVVDEAKGWGIRDDTFYFMEWMKKFHAAPFMSLGDRDLATHVFRTSRLAEGATLEQVTAEISHYLGVEVDIIPATNERLTSMVVLEEKEVTFEEYFVSMRGEPEPKSVYFMGSSSSRPPERAVQAVRECDVLVICPSNPVASISPILSVRGMYEEVARARAYRIAVSPIVSGKTIKGPADKMLSACGYEASALGVARYYSGLLDGLVIDNSDSGLMKEIGAMQVDCLMTDTIMRNQESKERLAREVLDFADERRST